MATLYLRGSVQRLTAGRVTLYQLPTVRSYVFVPLVSYSQDQVSPGFHGLRPFNLTAGRVTLVPAHPRTMVLASTGTSAAQRTRGRITLTAINTAQGAIARFGVWPLTATAGDPDVVAFKSLGQVTSGHVGAAWARSVSTFAVPRGTRYVGVGAVFQGVPNTGTYRNQYLKKAQLELTPITGYRNNPQTADTAVTPFAYSSAREVQVKVMADRMNWSTNPAFWVDTTDWTGVTRTALADPATASGFCGQVILAGGASASPTYTIPVLDARRVSFALGTVPFPYYTISVYVNATAVVPITQEIFTSYDLFNPIRTKTFYTTAEDAGKSRSSVRLQDTFYVGGSGDLPLTVKWTIGPAPTGGVTVRFFDMLIEKTQEQNRPYFDGSTSADHLWETGGTTGKTRSYYYQNRLERYAAMKRLLKANAPMGVGVADPQLATLPPT